MIVLGERIREYRLRGGKTQEALACELGVTAQAVSRWEKGACYPDMELLPSIANSFGVSIDELFGYDNERSRKVDELYRKITEMNRANNGVDVSMNECLCLAREALIEFPGNEKLTFALASALFNAGYVRRGEHHIEDREGFIVYDAARHRLYPEWQEAIKLYEKLLVSLPDGEMKQEAVLGLSQLYKNTGEREKAQRLAENAPALRSSRPFLLINASDGKEAAAASGKALIETVRASAELIEEIVRADRGIAPETAAAMLENAVSMLGLVFTDGRFGRLSGFAACLQMLRSYYLWLADDKDGAFSARLRARIRQGRRFAQGRGVLRSASHAPEARSLSLRQSARAGAPGALALVGRARGRKGRIRDALRSPLGRMEKSLRERCRSNGLALQGSSKVIIVF